MTAMRKPRLPREERETRVLDAAQALFYARGVHEIGMDELIAATGLGKATVYRLYPTKAELISAYLSRLSDRILAAVDLDIATNRPRKALLCIIDAVEADLRRSDFRGCPFNNASIEFADPDHPARVVARDYRRALLQRLTATAKVATDARTGRALGAHLAALIDGAYTSAAHLGPAGPASDALDLARRLINQARPNSGRPQKAR